MKSREFLLEYSRDITARQFGKKILEKYKGNARDIWGPEQIKFVIRDELSGMAGKISQEELIDKAKKILDQYMLTNMLKRMELNDPTPNKQYVAWMAREFAKGNIRNLEDLSARVRPALERFHRIKNTRAFNEYLKNNADVAKAKDINKIDWNTLEELMLKFEEPEAELKDKGSSKVVFDNDYVRVIKPFDQQAACYYGQGTRWCTAATRGENYFDYYNRKGPLYIIIPKKSKRPGEKYQLHDQSEQFMDEKDDPVPLSVIDDFPGLSDFFKETEVAELVKFTDPKILEGINKICLDKIEEMARDVMHEASLDDSDYQNMLMQYARDDDGDIDWDKVDQNPDLRYENYNLRYNKIFSTLDDMKSWDGEQIKNAITKSSDWADYQWIGGFYTQIATTVARLTAYFDIRKTFYWERGQTQYRKIGQVGPYVVLFRPS